MTIQMKLDTNALAHLMEQDPTFTVQLQQAVIENIAGRYIKGTQVEMKDAIARAAETERKKLLETYGSWSSGGWSKQFTLNTSFTSEIQREMQRVMSAEVDKLVKQMIEKELASLDSKIEAKVRLEAKVLTDKAIANEIKSKVQAALDQIKF